jgi:MFS family permease
MAHFPDRPGVRERMTAHNRRTRGRKLGSLLLDIGPLRAHRGFRWLFLGQIGGGLARQTLIVLVPYEVYVRTHSTLLVGLVGLVQVVPLVLFSLVGGVVADAFDRRAVLVTVNALFGVTATAFALNVSSPVLWPVFVLIAINAALSGMESPARTAMIPSLVPKSEIASAFALNQTLNQLMLIVGPALGGVVIVHAGIRASYIVVAASAIFASLAMVPIGHRQAEGAPGRIEKGATTEAWRYLRSVPMLEQMMLMDLNAMVFGMPRALFPAFGTVVLGGDAATVGLLHAAPGVGALIGALTTGWISMVSRQGRIVVIAIIVWGAAIAGFGFTRHLVPALILLALAGMADVVSNVFRSTILQTAVPDGLRGRITAFKGALSGGGPRLGDAEAGAVASATTTEFSIVSGGFASLFGAVLIAYLGRDIWHQKDGHPPRRRQQFVADAPLDPPP